MGQDLAEEMSCAWRKDGGRRADSLWRHTTTWTVGSGGGSVSCCGTGRGRGTGGLSQNLVMWSRVAKGAMTCPLRDLGWRSV